MYLTNKRSWYYHYTNVMNGWFSAKQLPEYVSFITNLVQCCKNIPQLYREALGSTLLGASSMLWT